MQICIMHAVVSSDGDPSVGIFGSEFSINDFNFYFESDSDFVISDDLVPLFAAIETLSLYPLQDFRRWVTLLVKSEAERAALSYLLTHDDVVSFSREKNIRFYVQRGAEDDHLCP